MLPWWVLLLLLFTIIFMSIIGGALLYPYTFVESKKIMAAAFFEQFASKVPGEEYPST